MKFQKASVLVLPFILTLSAPAFSQSARLPDKVPPASQPLPTQAPFQTDAAAPKTSESALMGLYDTERSEDVVPLDKPHRTSEQVASWVEDNITTAMNIDLSKWDTQLKKIRLQFDAYGFQEYQNYLKSSGILDSLQNNKFRLNAIADGPAVLLSEGALSGTYHWLYQMPMMLTYYDQDITGLRKGQAKPQNRKIMIRVQIGRAASGGNDDNHVFIEHWTVVNQ